MREFVVFTEAGADLSPQYIASHDIRVIPQHYTIDGEEYGGDKVLSPEKFYGKMRGGSRPVTKACDPRVIEQMYRDAIGEKKDILQIGYDAGLSATVDAEKLIASVLMQQLPGSRIVVIDSFSASLGEGVLAAHAQELKESGATLDETVKEIEGLAPHMSVVSAVPDAHYLYRSGRLTRASVRLSPRTRVKPLIHLDTVGEIKVISRNQGQNQLFTGMIEYMEKTIGSWRDKQLRVGIVHSDCMEAALQLQEIIKERFGYDDIFIAPLGPALGTYLGPDTLSLIFLADER
ncbi:MAG: DegV family protein [Lachnospiraceae bacterium]|nr:DegV family protein [Lachnospiraceae bacterium]